MSIIAPKFHGTNVIFWVGCVEARDDSKADDGLRLGRVRVRIAGFHSARLEEDDPSGEGIPVDKLLWAYPISPITSAAMNGIGQSPLGLVEGSWVMGIAMDGPAMQDLYVLGSLGGVPQKEANTKEGFGDSRKAKDIPDDGMHGPYPRKEYLGEEDTNRLARGSDSKKKHNVIKLKNDARIKPVEIANPGGVRDTWPEPEAKCESKYPYNHVYESESGHIREIDDTPEENSKGGPRSHEFHPSGTYTEIDRNGTKVHKITGSDYQIVIKDRNVYIGGHLNITVDKDARILVKGNCITEVEGETLLEAKKTVMIKSDKNIVLAAKDIQILAENTMTLISGGVMTQLGSNASPSDLAAGSI